MPDTPAIEVQHLTKRYATGHTAVSDLSLTIARGETVALSETTVKTHLGHVFEKLGVNDRTRAVTRAMELGLLA